MTPHPGPSITRLLFVFIPFLLLAAARVRADGRALDTARSTLTVSVFKSGLFSAFADNHIIQAPIASGTISAEAPLSIELTVHARDLKVLDPDMAPAKRADVQARMLTAEVLDPAKYADVQARMLTAEVLDPAKFADITFKSTAVEPAGADQWKVTGQLTLHGTTRPITVTASRKGNGYHGSVEIKQRDFGIEPISIGGGAVKVVDEVKIEFEIYGK